VFVITMDAYLNTAWYGIQDTPATEAPSVEGGIYNSGTIGGSVQIFAH
jgi:hypothetical protein